MHRQKLPTWVHVSDQSPKRCAHQRPLYFGALSFDAVYILSTSALSSSSLKSAALERTLVPETPERTEFAGLELRAERRLEATVWAARTLISQGIVCISSW